MSAVKGGMMAVLKEYVAKADPDEVETRLTDWDQARRVLRRVSQSLDLAANNVPKAFEETSRTTEAAKKAFSDSAEKLGHKADQLDAAIKALSAAQSTTRIAKQKHAQLEASLPTNHGPAPNPSDPKYAQTGTGVDSVQASQNQKALQADRAAHAAREQAIADAEAAAAQQIQVVDNDNYTAEPPVREITDDPNAERGSAPTAPSSPGSYSQIAASKARMEKYNSGTLYPDGWGHELIAQEKANIAQYEAENRPEWDGNQWINSDGSPAPATSYAMVETSEGLAPMGGGTSGMTALAIGGGGALLGAGVAKALANRFAAAGAAKAAAPGAAARSTAAKAGAAGARAGVGSAGARAGAAGARGSGAGAGARGAGGRGGPAGSGNRAGRTGAAGGRAGVGAAGGRGGKKDDKRNGQDQDWQADYTDDWTETANNVLDPEASRGWAPNAPQGDGSGTNNSPKRGG